MIRHLLSAFVAAALAFGAQTPANAGPIVFTASGLTAADITGQVNSFRSQLGTLNPNVATSFGTGRREINWDGVPDNFAAPNQLPANFFNVNSPRGVVLDTPGTGFEVSANAANPTSTPVEFGNINPAYPSFFAPFSAQRLFTALNSTVTDVDFFIPGSTIPAFVSGFGAVFSDVDVGNTTSIQFFDVGGQALGNSFFVPAISGNETFSFLGVFFNAGEQIGSVRITSGNQILSGTNVLQDLVVMDDFIYSEPRALATVPEPATLALIGLGIAGVAASRRRKLH